MALIFKDRVKETTTTTGTGTVTLGWSRVPDSKHLAAIGDYNTTYYAITSGHGTNWEVGLGTYTAFRHNVVQGHCIRIKRQGDLK